MLHSEYIFKNEFKNGGMILRHRSPFTGFVAGLVLVLNLISLIYGIIYLLAPGQAPLPNLFGVILLLALALNLLLVYLAHRGGFTQRTARWGTAYLLFSMIALAVMQWGGFLASSTYSREANLRLLFWAVYPAYFGILLIGALLSLLVLKQTRGGSGKAYGAARQVGTRLSAGRAALLVVLLPGLLAGLFCLYILFSDYMGLLQIFVSQNALFMAFFYAGLALLILRVCGPACTPLRAITGLLGLAMAVAFLLPLLLIPGAVTSGEAAFAAAFGDDWRERLDPDLEGFFRTDRFSLPAYFLGIVPEDYTWQENVLFYEGTDGVDEGLKLYFDVFMPPPDAANLPGSGCTIIRVHGGAWLAGDKGLGNMMQMNKYFAERGYTVFDVQYGLTSKITLTGLLEMNNFLGFTNRPGLRDRINGALAVASPAHTVGPFSLDDQVRHLGIFTHYLEEHASEYGAGLGSVFISGGSAGGHLTTAMTLAMPDPSYKHLFSPALTLKGYIPFYPANKVTGVLRSIGGAADFIDVERLVKADSPPCLIFQGTKDGMVPWETSASFKENYSALGNDRCAVLYMPLGAHACDLQFAGYYNQLFLYYMERFIALYR